MQIPKKENRNSVRPRGFLFQQQKAHDCAAISLILGDSPYCPQVYRPSNCQKSIFFRIQDNRSTGALRKLVLLITLSNSTPTFCSISVSMSTAFRPPSLIFDTMSRYLFGAQSPLILNGKPPWSSFTQLELWTLWGAPTMPSN